MPKYAIQSGFRYAALALLALATVSIAQESPADALLENYERALSSGLYDEAAVAAKSRLEQAIQDGRIKEMSSVGLLSDLALVQRLTGEFNSALQNYETAIDIVETKRDMLDIALTEPLLGIGKTYIDSGRPDLALQHLDRALHVRSVNAGPHSIEQAETLEVLADAYQTMGKPGKAADVADRLYLVYSRKYPGNSVQLVPILLKKGHILGEIGDWRRSRNAYVEALDIVEKADGDSSVNSIRPLIGMGNSHAKEYFELFFLAETEDDLPNGKLLVQAETYFESAMELTENAAAEDWRLVQDAMLALGDFFTMTNERSRARVVYRSAWDLLSTDDAKLLQRKINLEHIVPLLQPNPDLTVALPFDEQEDAASPQYQTGFIVSQFTVTRRGDLATIGLVEIVPERNEKIEAEVKSALTRFVYRPRFERGTAVDTAGQLIRFEFPYPE